MGLIRALAGATGGVLADQWKEFFCCDSIDKEVLMKKGQKRVSSRSSNTKASDNIISDGSGIVVADGQCMIIVEQGKVVELCAEPGQFTYNTGTEPSIFTGPLSQGIRETFRQIGKRFTFGGDTGKDQRVYYFNMKEILDNKFGTATPIPFRVVDARIRLDMDLSVRCNGLYSYKISDPILFYTNVSGNVADEYRREELDAQLKSEFIAALQPGFAQISALGVRPSALPGYTTQLADAMNEALSAKWGSLRGLRVVSVSLNSVTLPDSDTQRLQNAQQAAVYSDPSLAAGRLAEAQAASMQAAAANTAGAMTGFMGYGMAAQAGGVNTSELFRMGQTQQQPASAAADGWRCACGHDATGNFCPECGAKKPQHDGWTCACGAVNRGNFCTNCGAKRPAAAPVYRCNKCGWEPEDPKDPPKFCPECGDKFDDNDAR